MNPSYHSGVRPGSLARRTAAALVGSILVLASPLAAESLNARAAEQIRSLSEWKASWSPTEQRINSQLLAAARMARGLPITAAVPTLPGAWNTVRLDAMGTVEVDIKADVTAALLSSLKGLEAQVKSSFPQYRAIRARLPLLQVYAAADLPGVQFIAPAAIFVTNTGPHDSEGDAAHRAPAARTLGATGAGVKVGVISNGVQSLAARQASGDLPAGITVLAPGESGEDEGTAMLEIVYDLAPQAQLYFATADGGPAVMASNILALKAAGCRVIIDDVTYLDEAVFQDGIIAQAVKTVTDQGVLYFSSAANSGNKNDGTSGTWEGDFVNSGVNYSEPGDPGGPKPFHLFAAGVRFNAITQTTGLVVSLKWSDPLGASANDYDLYIVDGAGTVVAASEDLQNGTGDPFEAIQTASGVPQGFSVAIVKYSGAVRALHLDTNRGQLAVNTQGNTYGHNAAASALTVAATDAGTAGGGAFVGGGANPVELYSSDGPRRIFYNPNGTAITPGNVLFGTNGGTLLQKPDITAADCVVTGFPGGGTSPFNPFCGTSAAAPHAGAIAALAFSLASAPSAGQVKNAMLATALDIEGTGVDRDSGVGIVMADRTVNALQAPVSGTAQFHTLSPCRAIDTRDSTLYQRGAPALAGGLQRAFALAGVCGVPAAAKAVSVNVTVTGPTAIGDLRLFPVGVSTAIVSTINFYPGQTRANNAIVQLGGGTTASITVQNDGAGTVDLILDVNGYFQ
jgi:Subtilase family